MPAPLYVGKPSSRCGIAAVYSSYVRSSYAGGEGSACSVQTINLVSLLPSPHPYISWPRLRLQQAHSACSCHHYLHAPLSIFVGCTHIILRVGRRTLYRCSAQFVLHFRDDFLVLIAEAYMIAWIVRKVEEITLRLHVCIYVFSLYRIAQAIRIRE